MAHVLVAVRGPLPSPLQWDQAPDALMQAPDALSIQKRAATIPAPLDSLASHGHGIGKWHNTSFLNAHSLLAE
eukprot:1158677-Pelagomonas_calceolata.AAC.12